VRHSETDGANDAFSLRLRVSIPVVACWVVRLPALVLARVVAVTAGLRHFGPRLTRLPIG